MSFNVAIRRMGGFVSVVLAHSMQSLFYGGCSRSLRACKWNSSASLSNSSLRDMAALLPPGF